MLSWAHLSPLLFEHTVYVWRRRGLISSSKIQILHHLRYPPGGIYGLAVFNPLELLFLELLSLISLSASYSLAFTDDTALASSN